MRILIAALSIILSITCAYAGGFMLLHVGSPDGSSSFDIFVDSVNGSDANSGFTQLAPKQTIAAAQALISTSKKRIGLAKGSKWREQLTIAVDGSTVGSYGSGALPILDASDTISAGSWTKTAGLTNVYQTNITFANGGNSATWANLFETGAPGDSSSGQFLSLQTSTANVDAVAGSYLVTGMSAAGGIPAGSIVVYVHATDNSNPAVNGYTYEYSNRLAGLQVNGVGATVSNIEARKNAGNDGSFQFEGGAGVYNISGIIARDGGKHNALVPGGATIDSSTFINAYYSSNFGNHLVIHDNVGSNLGSVITNSYFQQDQLVDANNVITAIISHTGSGNLGTVTINNNWFIAKNSANLGGIGLQNAVASVIGNYGSQLSNFINFYGNATLTNNQNVTGFASNQLVQSQADNITITMSGNKWKPQHTSNGFFYLPNSGLTITDASSTYYVDTPGPNTTIYAAYGAAAPGNSLTLNGCIFDSALAGVYTLYFSGSGWTYTGGNTAANTFVAADSVNNWVLNGITYNTLAAWQGAGKDTNALTTGNGNFSLPTIPVIN